MEKICQVCDGNGYLQLLVGGSETCPNCLGSGIEIGKKASITVKKVPIYLPKKF